MFSYQFTAYAIDNEIDLTKLAASLGLNRKFRWEEPMVLHPETLRLAAPPPREHGQVYLFYFGGLVFVNCEKQLIASFFRRMAGFSEGFKTFPTIKYVDHYALEIIGNGPTTITNDNAVMPTYDPGFIDIICFVIAKSVALERIEEQVDTLLDEMEGMISLLEHGKLGIPDRRLAKVASTILNFKYKSIASVMVLDKPEITWDNAEADRLYLTMANLFELNQRYLEIKHKSETLMDITEVFSTLSHSRRAARLEWIIIILITLEIIIYLVDVGARLLY